MKNFDFYLNKAIKILLVINICIMLTILSFFFAPSVFAESSQFYKLDYSYPVNYPSSASTVVFSGSNPYVQYQLTSSSEFDSLSIYLFGVPNPSVSTAFDIYCFYPANDHSNNDNSSYFVKYSSSSSGRYILTQNNSIGEYFYRSLTVGLNNSLSTQFSIFPSIEDAYNAFIDELSPLPNYDGLRIPTGYYARIEFQNNSGSLTLNTTMSIASNTFGTPWPNSSQQWLSTGVSSAESFGNSSKIDIVWSKGGKPSIFGTTYQAIASLSSSNKYIWIYNPIQMNPIFITDGTYYPPNDVITISDLVNVKSVRLYSVTASIFGPATTSDSSYYDSVVSSDGAIGWVDSNGDISTPPNGGGNSQSTDSDSVIQQFRSLLSDLVGRIESLLVAPVEYIQRIINAGSTFFSWLAGLWSWLPPAVSGILTSVLYIMAVVGALKLLWR